MPGLIHAVAICVVNNLIHPIPKLIAAILDRNSGLRQGSIYTVIIDNHDKVFSTDK
jgi:hypothetical protein